MKVFIVHLTDRHFDDVITVHADRASADREVARIKGAYDSPVEWRWNERENTWRSYDDGPTIHVEEKQVKP